MLPVLQHTGPNKVLSGAPGDFEKGVGNSVWLNVQLFLNINASLCAGSASFTSGFSNVFLWRGVGRLED